MHPARGGQQGQQPAEGGDGVGRPRQRGDGEGRRGHHGHAGQVHRHRGRLRQGRPQRALDEHGQQGHPGARPQPAGVVGPAGDQGPGDRDEQDEAGADVGAQQLRAAAGGAGQQPADHQQPGQPAGGTERAADPPGAEEEHHGERRRRAGRGSARAARAAWTGWSRVISDHPAGSSTRRRLVPAMRSTVVGGSREPVEVGQRGRPRVRRTIDSRGERRRPAEPRPRPPRTRTPGRLRGVRRLGARRGGGQAHLLRPLRPPAPRAGVRRHRGQQRLPDHGLQGHGPGVPGVRRDDAQLPDRPPGHRARALLHHGRQRVEERPADVPADRLGRPGPRPQRQPHQHRGAGALAQRARPAGGLARPGRDHPQLDPRRHARLDQRHLAGHRADVHLPRPDHRAGGRRGAAEAQGGVQPRVHGRGDALRRPRPAGHPAAGAGPARARLGGGERDGRPGHRGRLLRPRDRARRDGRRRRERACAAPASPRPPPRAACSSSSTSPVPTPPSRASACTRCGSRSAGRSPRSSRSTPTW